MRQIIVIFFLLATFFVLPAHAEMENLFQQAAESPEDTEKTDEIVEEEITGDFSSLRYTETTSIERVIDGMRIALEETEGKRIVQLAGIEIPGMTAYAPSEISTAARDYLAELLEHGDIKLYQTKDKSKGRINRMGYHLAQLQTSSNIWIQGALIARGLARARPSGRNPEMAEQMYLLEAKARNAGAGLWADDKYTILTPENAADGINSFAIIEGTVKKSAIVRNTIYLNFGQNWKTDFTVGITPEIRKQLSRRNITALNLANQKIRVRGWLESYNGPYLKLIDAAQMEILPADNKGQANSEVTR
jgi:endonuclease YncB( thermonuclease family)